MGSHFRALNKQKRGGDPVEDGRVSGLAAENRWPLTEDGRRERMAEQSGWPLEKDDRSEEMAAKKVWPLRGGAHFQTLERE